MTRRKAILPKESKKQTAMLNKKDLQTLKACLEIVVKSGKVEPEALISVGVTYNNIDMAIKSLEDGDVLIKFTPAKKNTEQELPQQGSPDSPDEK